MERDRTALPFVGHLYFQAEQIAELALEHLEIARRYPKGGGGVSAASEAFGPRVGVVSGALMVSAYLLTIAISVVTALHYIAVIRPFAHEIPVMSVAAPMIPTTRPDWSRMGSMASR